MGSNSTDRIAAIVVVGFWSHDALKLDVKDINTGQKHHSGDGDGAD